MDPATLRTLLIAIAGLLAAATIAAAVTLRLQKRQERLRARVGTVLGGYSRAVPVAEVRRSARLPAQTTPVLHQAGRLLGYDPRYASHYLTKWWVVVLISLGLARLAAQLLVPLFGWVALALVPVAALFGCRTFHRWCINRRKRALYGQFPDALAMITRGVRVGVPVAESMLVVSRESEPPTAGEFRLVADRVALGSALDKALYDMAERNGIAEYRFFAISIGLQSQTGGALSETLDNLADVIRKRVALRARGVALASEARTSIIILCALPVVTGLAISVLNPDYISHLFDNDLGKQLFGAALLSFSSGLAIMQWIVKKSLS